MRANWIMVAVALGAGIGIGLLARPGREIPDGGRAEHSTSPVRTKSSSRSTSTPPISSGSVRDKVAARPSVGEEARRLGLTPDPQDGADVLALYTEWAQGDPYAAINQAIALGDAGGHLRHRVMQVWARRDPATAAEFFSSHRHAFVPLVPQAGTPAHLATPSAAAQAIAREWAAIDPAAAQAWARTLPPGDGALRTVLGTLAGRSPSLAVDALSGISPGDQAPYLKEIAENWAAKDYSEARKWIDQLPVERREEVLVSALTGLAESDPVKAAEELLSAPTNAQRRLAGSLGRTWSQQDPHAAAEWLRQPGNEQLRSAAAGPVVEGLGRRDPQAAWQLVQAMAGSDAYDPSVAAYIRTQSHESPEKLLELSDGIRDEAARGQAIALIISRWSATDPQAAASFQERRFPR